MKRSRLYQKSSTWMIDDRYLIIDGLNLFMRHYVAHPAMSENGDQVGGLVGFFNNLTRLIGRCRPERVIVVWEGGGSKRKRAIYSDYKKGSRPQKLNRYYDHAELPDSIRNRNFQMFNLVKLLDLVPVTQIYIEDAEADDAIGYLTKYKLSDKNNIIVSSDHDYYQLLNDSTLIWSPTLKSFVDKVKVIDRFHTHPENFCLAKSVVGDTSDNITGIRGVGYKTLSKCFQDVSEAAPYSISSLIKDAKKFSLSSKRKIYKNVISDEKLIRRNWKLILLDVNNLSHKQVSKLDNKVENFTLSWKNIEAHKLLNKLGIRGVDLLTCNQIFKQLNRRKKDVHR